MVCAIIIISTYFKRALFIQVLWKSICTTFRIRVRNIVLKQIVLYCAGLCCTVFFQASLRGLAERGGGTTSPEHVYRPPPSPGQIKKNLYSNQCPPWRQMLSCALLAVVLLCFLKMFFLVFFVMISLCCFLLSCFFVVLLFSPLFLFCLVFVVLY